MNIENEAEEMAAFLAALEGGLALFNQGEFFAAYEVWAERWNEETTDGADLLQGLLQVAVGFAKLDGGSPEGTIKLLRSGAEKIMMYAPEAYGIDIAALVSTLDAWRAAVERGVAQGSLQNIEFPAVAVPLAKSNDSKGSAE